MARAPDFFKEVFIIVIPKMTKILALLVFLLVANIAVGQSLLLQRQDFLHAEKLLASGNEAAYLNVAESLTTYPLYPYLHHQWLQDHLQETDKVLIFLRDYKETRQGQSLRKKWLAYLAKMQRWRDFTQHYQADDDEALACSYYWALHQTGKRQLALAEAMRLWITGDEQPKNCDALLAALINSPLLTQDLIWQRFEAALDKHNISLAVSLRRLLGGAMQKNADNWLAIHKNPKKIKDSGLWLGGDAETGRLFVYGTEQLLKSDLELAIQLWDGRKTYLKIAEQDSARIERKLAVALATNHDFRAYQRLSRLAAPDDKAREWRVRIALQEQNWQHINDAVAGLSTGQLQMPVWQYWRARALAATGKAGPALEIYQKLAEDRSFYGFLAADTIGKPYNLNDKPVPLTENQLDTLAEQTDFKAVQEFNLLNRELEARRQWWFAIKKLDKNQLRQAAKLAQKWNWDQIAIMTLAKAEYWDDLALRFPVRHFNEVKQNADRFGLDPALVFGVMRQESMLDNFAVSPVGAKGLMQMMPETGRQVADKLGEAWRTSASLFDPELSIRYGSFYLQQLLRRFDGHIVLAIAAYNAGPKRVGQWLPSITPLQADIWIETIPYQETRKYVTSVLTYAVLYQARLQHQKLKIKDLLVDVLAH